VNTIKNGENTMNKLILVSLIAIISLPCFASDKIINGSFENPVINTDWKYILPTNVPGWDIAHTFTTGNEFPVHLEFWSYLMGAAFKGNQYVELDSYDPTKISQNITTVPGIIYTLSYAWKPRSGVNCNMQVLINNIVNANHTGTTGDWKEESIQFTAISNSTNICFQEVGNDDQLGMLLDAVSVPFIEVNIDVKPGSYPNAFNINGSGVVPVAILGSAELDVTCIDPASLSFGGLTVRTKKNGSIQYSIEDVNGDYSLSPEGQPDGYLDLVVQFVDDDNFMAEGDGTGCLSGTCYDGIPIHGCDTIKLVNE
jgi:hypothetical protein